MLVEILPGRAAAAPPTAGCEARAVDGLPVPSARRSAGDRAGAHPACRCGRGEAPSPVGAAPR